MKKVVRKQCVLIVLPVLVILTLVFWKALLIFPKNILPGNVVEIMVDIKTVHGYDTMAERQEITLSPSEGRGLIDIISTAVLVKDPFLPVARPAILDEQYFMIWINFGEESGVAFNFYADGTSTIWIGDETIQCRVVYPKGSSVHRSIAKYLSHG